jgi:ABC-type oligopeptide transport system ATPase subunit
MNTFETNPIRERYDITTNEEYIIGMVNNLGSMSTTRILETAQEHKVMSNATAHKYLKAAVAKKLLLQRWDKKDKRNTEFTVGARGNKLLEELKHAYGRK